jgi:hypothetical protein
MTTLRYGSQIFVIKNYCPRSLPVFFKELYCNKYAMLIIEILYVRMYVCIHVCVYVYIHTRYCWSVFHYLTQKIDNFIH